MQRLLYQDLIKWKNNNRRKPLLIQGARQVGKTFLVNQFGNNEYQKCVYLNFEQNPKLMDLFPEEINPKIILENIGLYLGVNLTAGDTLIFFDEIQDAPRVITSLKYFFENAPEYHVIAAGSLLGVSVGKENSFPVGKVNFMTLHPMSFEEYLMALGEQMLIDKINTTKDIQPLPEIIHEKLEAHFKRYLFIGGMPEVLQSYLDEKDMSLCRNVQLEILEAYKRDFSKYTSKIQAIRTKELWQSIPYQLARESKRFKYSDVKKKARASTFETTIEWLKSAGLVLMTYNISTPKIPLAAYSDYSKFKIYLLDTGLLGAMLGVGSDILVKGNNLFTEFKGAFIENYVAQELRSSGEKELFYWTSRGSAEVDFVLQHNDKIIPLEVKSGTNRNLKSLRVYSDKFKPELICRASPRNFHHQDDFLNIPLYGVFGLKSLVEFL